MVHDFAVTSANVPARDDRRPWIPPAVRDLPKLTALTLASAIGGGGGTGGGGSTVFALLLAVGLLAGCMSSDEVAPTEHRPSPFSAMVTCQADVAARSVTCAGPSTTAGQEIIGGQGTRVALRSSNVAYAAGVFSFDVTVQNLTAQSLGSDEFSDDSIAIFFETDPVVTSGTGTITYANAQGPATFTAGGQYFFAYDSLSSGATSGPVNWQLNIPGTVNTFTFTVQVAASVPDFQGVLRWVPMAEFASDSFTGIAVNSATDAMAVGIHGATMHKVGSRWVRMPVQLNEDWVGVSAIGGGKYVGATAQGSVAIFDGKVWNVISNRGYQIDGMVAAAANRIAVGGSQKLEWYGDNGWYSLGFGGSQDFFGFSNTHAAQGLAASNDGTVCQFAYNLNQLSVSCAGSAPVDATYGWTGDNSGWSYKVSGAGYIKDQNSGFILNAATDTTFTALELGGGAPYLWAVAHSDVTDSSRLYSFTLGAWTDHGVVLGHRVIRMVQDSAGGLYFLSADGIRHWNGSSVVDELVAPTAAATAIWGDDSLAYVGMSDGHIRRYLHGAWHEEDPGTGVGILAVRGFGPSSAQAIDSSGNVLEFNGVSWTSISGIGGPRGFWAWDANNVAVPGWVSIPAALVFRGDLHSSPTVDFDPAGVTTPLNAVWGMSPSDFWVVGDGGVVLHFDGATYNVYNPGTSEDLLAIHGLDNNDIWISGTNGYIAYWDGATWTQLLTGGSGISAIWTPRHRWAYLGHTFGEVTALDLDGGFNAEPLPFATGQMTALSGSSTNGLWAIVGTGIYRGLR